MGIFIGGPLNGVRVTDEPTKHGQFVRADEPVPPATRQYEKGQSPAIESAVKVGHYSLICTVVGHHKEFHYLWEGMDKKEGLRRAMEWHDPRLARGQ